MTKTDYTIEQNAIIAQQQQRKQLPPSKTNKEVESLKKHSSECMTAIIKF